MYYAMHTSGQENLAVLADMVLYRDEVSKRLGYRSFAHRTLHDKMAKEPAKVRDRPSNRFFRACLHNWRDVCPVFRHVVSASSILIHFTTCSECSLAGLSQVLAVLRAGGWAARSGVRRGGGALELKRRDVAREQRQRGRVESSREGQTTYVTITVNEPL